MELEHKFSSFDAVVSVTDDLVIEGYASCFGDADQGGDTVQPGAYAASLASGRGVKMLWQHDVTQPIGVWDELREDTHGLWVKGRLLDGVARAKEAAALIRAGAIDGLSIGYRTRRAVKNAGGGRTLMELELWAKGDVPDADWRDLAAVFRDARLEMAGLRPGPNPLSER